MDLLVMGSSSLCVPSGDGTEFRVFHRESVLKQLKLTDRQFREMCAMCFTETQEKVQ